MKECNAKAVGNESASAVKTLSQSPADRQYPAFIGLDVHKETIAVAVDAAEGLHDASGYIQVAREMVHAPWTLVYLHRWHLPAYSGNFA